MKPFLISCHIISQSLSNNPVFGALRPNQRILQKLKNQLAFTNYIRFLQLALLICSLTAFELFAQNATKQVMSPNVASLLKVNANDVDLFTGNPVIEIPIKEFDIDDYKVQVGLKYAGGGIRVFQTSGSFGLGWHLAAGGSIVRHMKSWPDESVRDIDHPSTVPIFRRGYIALQQGFPNLKSPRNIDFYHWLNFASQTSNGDAVHNELFKGYFFATTSDLRERTIRDGDSDPDIFEFNFNGKSGKFVFDNNNGIITVRQIPWMGLKFDYTIDPNGNDPQISKFVITDTDKTKYYFEAKEITNYSFYSNSVGVLGTIGRTLPEFIPELISGFSVFHYVSAWHLTKVVTSSNKVISYEYEDETVVSNPVPMQAKNRYLGYRLNSTQDTLLNITDDNKSISIAKRLRQIDSDLFRMEFVSEENRQEDNRGYLIKKINVFSKFNNALINTTEFKYAESLSPGINLASSNKRKEYTRRILTEVINRGNKLTNVSKSYKLFYNLAGFGGDETDILPHMSSFSIDQWGYFNGAANTILVPKMYIYPDISLDNRRFRVEKLTNYTGREFVLNGADRTPNANLMDIGMLNKIVHPTGGAVRYVFEPNNYIDEGQAFIGPGVRIREMTREHGEKSESYFYEYNNSSGVTSGRITARPIMAKILTHFINPVNDFDYYEKNLSRFSDTQVELNSIDSRILGYSMVTKIFPQNGKEVNYFSLNAVQGDQNDLLIDENDDFPSGTCIINYEKGIGYCDGYFYRPKVFHIPFGDASQPQYNSYFSFHPAAENTTPFVPDPNYDWNRGHLLMNIIYDEHGRMISRTVNQYQNYTPGIKTPYTVPYRVYGFKVSWLTTGRADAASPDPIYAYVSGSFMRASKYSIITDITKVLASVSKTSFYPGSNQSSQTITTSYRYDSEFHHFPTKVENVNSKGQIVQTEYRYPPDMINASGNTNSVFQQMTLRNRINIPVHVKKKVNDRYISEIYNDYDVFYDQLFLKKAEHYKNGSGIDLSTNLDRKITYDLYDNTGNLCQYTNEKGVPVAIVWGYNKQFPVLKAVGITYQQLGSEMQFIDDFFHDKINDGNFTLNLFDEIRHNFPNAMITSYIYTPSGKVSGISDVRGKAEFYEYDEFDRLRVVKNDSGLIVKTYGYNYSDH